MEEHKSVYRSMQLKWLKNVSMHIKDTELATHWLLGHILNLNIICGKVWQPTYAVYLLKALILNNAITSDIAIFGHLTWFYDPVVSIFGKFGAKQRYDPPDNTDGWKLILIFIFSRGYNGQKSGTTDFWYHDYM